MVKGGAIGGNIARLRWISGMTSLVVALSLAPLSGIAAPTNFLWPDRNGSAPLMIARTPNDPRFSEQTNLNQVKIPPAWDVTVGSSSQIVAIIDTGVNPDHEELLYRIWTNDDETPGNGKDDDNNGYVDDYRGYNFMNNTTDILDQNGHGTGIASIIAANTDNGRGMAGINWQTKIMVLKALNSAGGGEYTDVADALHYAADNGARVVNMSFGTYFDSTDLQAAVDYAISKGVTIVAAAGNNNQSQLLYPAGYSNVVAVGAVDGTGQRASFSNYGNALDVVAPGINVLMANYVGNNAYVYGSGTSFAAAHVSGLVSLLLARNSTLVPAQIESVVKGTATNMNNPLEYGSGIVNAASALGSSQATDRITGRITSSSTHALADGVAKIRVNVLVTNNDFPAGNHQIRVYANAPVIINETFVDQRDIYVGSTDMSGNLNFTLSSNISGQKLLIFSDTTAGVNLGDITLIFDPLTGVAANYSAAKVAQSSAVTLAPGEQATLWVDVRNTGNVAWSGKGSLANGQMRLGTFRPQDRQSQFYANGWLSNNRAATLQQSLVQPGEVSRFEFVVTAPAQPSTYREYFNPVVEYVAWLADTNIYWDITVSNNGVDPDISHYNVEVIYKSANLIVSPGQTGMLQLEIRNIGGADWVDPTVATWGAVRLGTVQPYDRASLFHHPSWISPNRTMDTGFAVDTGDRLVASFIVKAPLQPGVYYESFRFVSEYLTWFGPVISWKITVQ